MNRKNVVLIGMPATGKSTAGVILAKLIGYGFIDTDILLALDEKRPLSRIIAEDGYNSFIEAEGRAGENLKCEGAVIATGGSMVFSENAMKALSENGVVVWLDTPVEELEKRVPGSQTDRGIATPFKMTMREIYEMREPLYRKYAQLRIPCAGTTEQVVSVLREKLKSEGYI